MKTIIRTDSVNKNFIELVALLDKDLKLKDGDDHAFYSRFNSIEMVKHVVVYCIKNKAVGCGAFKLYDKSTVEIKRMFVQPGFRGKGVGLHILKELEQWAAALKYNYSILETGLKQVDAIRLYEKAGYARINNYGQYAGIENSVCMKKAIG